MPTPSDRPPGGPGESAIPRPLDAWVLSRALCGLDVEADDLAATRPSWRPMAEHLARQPSDGRPVAWQAMLAARPDGDLLVARLLEVDPQGPRPDAEADVEPEPPSPVILRAASEIVARPVEWLWRPRVPLGMLSLFAGDPKLGKSFVTIDLAAAVSRGAPMPLGDVPAGPARVLLLNAEDDPARTIVPRLKEAGADLSRVLLLEGVRAEDGSPRLPQLRHDLAKIDAAAASLGDCRLVIVDPISAYLGGVDDHRNAELRGVLSPLKALAERLDLAVVLVTHLNKSPGTNGKHRVTGSIAYVGACRTNYLFARDPTDPTGSRRLMLENGQNLGPDVPTLAFRIAAGDGVGRVEWEPSPVDITLDQALRAEAEGAGDRPESPSRARECEMWLESELAAGERAAIEVLEKATEAGFSRKQVERSRERLGVASRRE
ncbi:MAG: AAA family ATPase, partial [Isosphaeraceae bacterium]